MVSMQHLRSLPVLWGMALLITLGSTLLVSMSPRDQNVQSNRGKRILQDQDAPEVRHGFVCKGNRLNNETPLYRGEAVCSKRGGYLFGLSPSGNLVWRDTEEKERERFSSSRDAHRFVLHDDGRMALYGEDGEVKWERKSKKRIALTASCLTPQNCKSAEQDYDCPYIHLHGDGVAVLNWIDDDDAWIERRIQKAYDDI